MLQSLFTKQKTQCFSTNLCQLGNHPDTFLNNETLFRTLHIWPTRTYLVIFLSPSSISYHNMQARDFRVRVLMKKHSMDRTRDLAAMKRPYQPLRSALMFNRKACRGQRARIIFGTVHLMLLLFLYFMGLSEIQRRQEL